MYDYIEGKITEITPAQIVLENNGIGYLIQISLQTYGRLRDSVSARVYIRHLVREDDEQLFGFADRDERDLFTLLISVSGVGPNTARMMLSSLTADEVRQAIVGEDLARIKSVKGIGLKTAQRIIIELKDKIVKGSGTPSVVPGAVANPARSEASAALQMLGFAKPAVEKVLDQILRQTPDCPLEDLIKKALKSL